jgi:hypothetical protein
MEHSILEAYKMGKKIRHKEWHERHWISRGENTFSPPVYNILGEDKLGIINALLVNPHLFELYQEPKKAYIETPKFVKRVSDELKVSTKSCSDCGAIAIIKEFVKRYFEDDGYAVHTMKETTVCRILIDLVGEENLE